MLKFENLSKAYGNHKIFEGVSYSFPSGLFALLGPNGTGKSTLLSVLSGAESFNKGDVWIDGHHLQKDALAARQAMAYVPDKCIVYPFITGREFIEFVFSVRKADNRSDIECLIAAFNLAVQLDKPFEAMSFGTQKKFMLIAAFIGNPAVMLVDEPTNGIDVASWEVLASRFTEKRNQGTTILFSSHDTEFVTRVSAQTVQLADIMKEVAQ